jgi:hypothetical protein
MDFGTRLQSWADRHGQLIQHLHKVPQPCKRLETYREGWVLQVTKMHCVQ